MNIGRMFLFIGFILIFIYSMGAVFDASDYSKKETINDTFNLSTNSDAESSWSEEIDEEYDLYFATEMFHVSDTVFSCVSPCVGERIALSIGYNCSQWMPRSTTSDKFSGKNCQHLRVAEFNQSIYNESEFRTLKMTDFGEPVDVYLNEKEYIEGHPNSNISEASDNLTVHLNTTYRYSDNEDWSDEPRDRILRYLPLIYTLILLVALIMVVRE